MHVVLLSHARAKINAVMMKDVSKSSGKCSYVIYDSETVIYDGDGNRLLACPTEQEAIEFITSRNGRIFDKEQ